MFPTSLDKCVILNEVKNLVFAGQRFFTSFRMTKKESFSGPALSGWPTFLSSYFDHQIDLTGFVFTGLIPPSQTRQVFAMILQCVTPSRCLPLTAHCCHIRPPSVTRSRCRPLSAHCCHFRPANRHGWQLSPFYQIPVNESLKAQTGSRGVWGTFWLWRQ